MNPITHLLASWSLAEASELELPDRNLVAWCGVLPDLDGLGALVDIGNRVLRRPESVWYGQFHHTLLHGLFGAVFISSVLATRASRRGRVFLFGLVAVHLHLLCDLLGSRGPDAADVWPIHYLSPFSERLSISWSGQWALNAWPNIVFTLALLAFAFYRAVSVGHSPVSLFGRRANELFVGTVRARWQRLSGAA
jgi:LexA-binding, inner membrane-associated putative hydrolase